MQSYAWFISMPFTFIWLMAIAGSYYYFMRQCFIYLFLFVILLLANATYCQPNKFNVVHYDETNGLQTNIVNDIIQDKKGYMWFGTIDGLYRYDGYTFKLFKGKKNDKNSLQNNNVLHLAEDKNGIIWMGLQAGISSYDPASGTFTNYSINAVDAASSHHEISMMYIDDENTVWAGLLQKGLIRLDKSTGTFSQYDVVTASDSSYSKELRSVYNSVYGMYEEGKNKYWLATHDGLYRFDSQTGTVHPVRLSMTQGETVRNDLFRTIVPDKTGLWLGAYCGGVSHYSFASTQWQHYKFNFSDPTGVTTNIVTKISFSKSGELWMASGDKGIGAFDTATKRFDFYSDHADEKGLLPSAICYTFYRDNQNNLWLSYPTGLYKVHYYENDFYFVPLRIPQTLHNIYTGTTALLDDSIHNTLFVGTAFADGLHVTDKSSGRTDVLSFPMLPNEEADMLVRDLIRDHNGNVWVLTRDYIYQYDYLHKKLVALPQPPLYTANKPSNSYNFIREDSQGNIWISSFRNGVFCYHPVTRSYEHFDNNPGTRKSIPFNVITCMEISPSGDVWIGSSRGGLGYINKEGSFVAVNQSERFYSLYCDREGIMWAGMADNVSCYQPATKKLIKSFDEENGLRGSFVEGIHGDNRGNIWCFTNAAICRISTGDVVTSYAKQEGIDIIGSLYGLYSLSGNKMAVTTSDGYYLFDPSAIQKRQKPLPVYITSFKIDDKEQYFESLLKHEKQVMVPASANVISFEYAALDFTHPAKQQYLYKLEGFDKDWIQADNRRYVSYANLPGGDYVFKVKAMLPEEVNNSIASIPVHINTAVYKTGWFITLATGLVFFSIYLFYRFKLKKQQQLYVLQTKTQLLEKEKALAQYEGLKQHLNPHFLFNSLTSLSSLIQYNQKEAGQFLEGLSKIYRYILKSRDAETVPLREERIFVQTFIRLQQTRFGDGLLVNVNLPEEFDSRKIVPATLQNMIENAIKHNIVDDESPLQIDIFIEGDSVIVANNLQKKNFVETSNRQGLANLISLYRYLTSKSIVIEESDTHFSISIPLL